MTPQTKKRIEEEFDEKFSYFVTDFTYSQILEEVKDFFLSTLSHLLEEREDEIVKWLESQKDNLLANAEGLMDDETRVMKLKAIIRNQAFQDTITYIKSLRELEK